LRSEEPALLGRRAFLRAAAGVAAGTILAAPQVPPARRRQVAIGGRRIKVVDIHGHFIAPEELDLIKDTNLTANISNQPGSLILDAMRLRAMDEQGIDVQVLSHQGAWWYRTDRGLAERLIKVQNERLAGWCSAHPDRFVGLASVALQYPDLAVQQLEYAIKSLGFRGVGIGGHVAGEVPSTPQFDPFWAKAAELGIVVFVHPAGAENIVRDGALGGRGDLGNIIGNPLETTVFLTRMIFDGTLDRFPGLRIIGAHAGGYLPSYLGRTDVACDVRPNANCANKKKPRDYFRQQLFADSMALSEEGLRHLVAEVGAGQVVYGTDIPYNWPAPVDLILGASFLNNMQKEAILGGTLVKLLRIPA
jgi:aminocarboxymuconate-semialdehyde decarboxylase